MLQIDGQIHSWKFSFLDDAIVCQTIALDMEDYCASLALFLHILFCQALFNFYTHQSCAVRVCFCSFLANYLIFVWENAFSIVWQLYWSHVYSCPALTNGIDCTK